MYDFENLTDQECLEIVTDLVSKRMTVQTVYQGDDDEQFFTHQILVFQCGDMEAISEPKPLTHPLMLAPIITGTIN